MAVKKTMGKKPVLTPEEQEKIIQAAQRNEEKIEKAKVQRVTVDFPLYLYDKMKGYTDDTGQSLKSFIVGEIRTYFEALEEKKRNQ
jgi:hypothetical protein